jgi:hypothetical protein
MSLAFPVFDASRYSSIHNTRPRFAALMVDGNDPHERTAGATGHVTPLAGVMVPQLSHVDNVPMTKFRAFGLCALHGQMHFASPFPFAFVSM